MIIPDNFYHEIDKRTIRNLKQCKEIGRMPISRFSYNTEDFEIISCNEKEIVLKCNHKHYEEYIVRCYFDENKNKKVSTTNTANNKTHVYVQSNKDKTFNIFFNKAMAITGYEQEKKVNKNSKRQILLSFLDYDLNNSIKLTNVVFLKRSKIFKVKFKDSNDILREITYNPYSLEVNYDKIKWNNNTSDVINFNKLIGKFLNVGELKTWVKKQYRFKYKLIVRDCHVVLSDKINKELSEHSRFMYSQNTFRKILTNIIAVYKLKDYDLSIKENGVKIVLKNKNKTLSLNLQFRKVKDKFIMDFRDFNKEYENYHFDYSVERVERKEKEYKPQPQPKKPKKIKGKKGKKVKKAKTVKDKGRVLKRRKGFKKNDDNNNSNILSFDKNSIEKLSRDELRNKIISDRLCIDEFIC